MKTIKQLFVCSAICLALAGCGSGNNNTQDTAGGKAGVSNEPVTLTISTTKSAGMNDEDFQLLLADPVKKKYPNITLNLVRVGKGMQLEDQIAAGNTPDMIMIFNGQVPKLREVNLFMDITPLIKKFNVDLNRFESVDLDAIKAASDNGGLYGLPYTSQLNALYYNKSIFDKFGVPYPKDGMTWDDVIDLAKKVTRSDGAVDYRGLDPDNISRLSFPLGLVPVDADTNKPLIDNDLWRKAFDVGYRIYTIPGNGPSKTYFDFASKKNVAMHAGVNLFDRLTEPTSAGFTEWDVAQYPSYKGYPNTFGKVDVHLMTISKTSKHQDQAMQVIDLLTSDEVQTIAARDALRATPLKSVEIKSQFGQGNPLFKDKHISSIFKSHPAPAMKSPVVEGGPIVKAEFAEYIAGKKDVNTMIRDAEQRINQLIAEQQ